MRKLTIIDNKIFPKSNKGIYETKIYWNRYSIDGEKNAFSILKIIEDNSDLIKSIYLNWINEIGNIKIDKKPLYENFKIRNLYSLWWQSYFIQKSNYEHSVQIIDAIKLIALQEWLKNNRFEMFSLFTSNNNLYLSLEELSNNLEFILMEI